MPLWSQWQKRTKHRQRHTRAHSPRSYTRPAPQTVGGGTAAAPWPGAAFLHRTASQTRAALRPSRPRARGGSQAPPLPGSAPALGEGQTWDRGERGQRTAQNTCSKCCCVDPAASLRPFAHQAPPATHPRTLIKPRRHARRFSAGLCHVQHALARARHRPNAGRRQRVQQLVAQRARHQVWALAEVEDGRLVWQRNLARLQRPQARHDAEQAGGGVKGVDA